MLRKLLCMYHQHSLENHPSIITDNQDLNQILHDYTVEVTTIFKGLDLIDRVPEELLTQVPDVVQEAGIKTIPKEKKCKKAKWLSEEALQIAEKRREVKVKGEKERYIHLNAEFQRIVMRDEKASLSNQCKDTEDNNRMGKSRDEENQRFQRNISCRNGQDKGRKW